jgi:hypothetical protein
VVMPIRRTWVSLPVTMVGTRMPSTVDAVKGERRRERPLDPRQTVFFLTRASLRSSSTSYSHNPLCEITRSHKLHHSIE